MASLPAGFGDWNGKAACRPYGWKLTIQKDLVYIVESNDMVSIFDKMGGKCQNGQTGCLTLALNAVGARRTSRQMH